MVGNVIRSLAYVGVLLNCALCQVDMHAWLGTGDSAWFHWRWVFVSTLAHLKKRLKFEKTNYSEVVSEVLLKWWSN